MSQQHFDLVIVGGGMVGSALACALGDSGLSVAVIEAQEPDLSWPREGYDLRVSAITRASQNIFSALGVWEEIVARRAHAYRDMHVWDATGSGEIHFDSAEIGEADLGHIIENSVIQAALWQRLDDFDNITRLCPMSLMTFVRSEEGIVLTSESGESIRAHLLVGADGGRSWVRQQAGIEVHGWDYDQHALVTYVETEYSHQDTAWQRFMPNGPLAFLPLDEGISSIVWSTSPEQAQQLLTLPEADFMQQLESAFAHRLGRIIKTGARAVFPLRLQHAKHYVQPHLALVGDAAHTIHPLAGQGVNLGLADAATLAQVILEARQEGRDIASMAVLRRYERWRKADNLAMQGAMEAFKRLFGSRLRPLRWLRNAGMSITHRLPLIKNLAIRHAMGLEGQLPRLARKRPG